MPREKIILACEVCKNRNYFTDKNKRLLDINASRPQTMDALPKPDLPAGVDVQIKVE